MSEDLNAVEEVVETPEAEIVEAVEAEVAVEDVISTEEVAVEAAVEEEIAAVVPEKKATSRGKKFQAEPEDAAEVSVELEEVVEVVVPEPTPTPVAVTPVVTSGGMSLSIRNRK
jgi:hypothetical protein